MFCVEWLLKGRRNLRGGQLRLWWVVVGWLIEWLGIGTIDHQAQHQQEHKRIDAQLGTSICFHFVSAAFSIFVSKKIKEKCKRDNVLFEKNDHNNWKKKHLEFKNNNHYICVVVQEQSDKLNICRRCGGPVCFKKIETHAKKTSPYVWILQLIIIQICLTPVEVFFNCFTNSCLIRAFIFLPQSLFCDVSTKTPDWVFDIIFFFKDLLTLYFTKVIDMSMSENFTYHLNIETRRQLG